VTRRGWELRISDIIEAIENALDYSAGTMSFQPCLSAVALTAKVGAMSLCNSAALISSKLLT
jgi:hypothetical protein